MHLCICGFCRQHVQSQFAILSPASQALWMSRMSDIPQIPFRPDCLLSSKSDFGRGASCFLDKNGHNGRIDFSRAGAHHETVKRRCSHGGIDTFSVLYRGHGTPIPQMTGDQIDLVKRNAQEFCSPVCNISVRCPMEAVTADSIVRIGSVGQRIQKGFFRHGLVKFCIKDTNIGYSGEKMSSASSIPARPAGLCKGERGNIVSDDFF